MKTPRVQWLYESHVFYSPLPNVAPLFPTPGFCFSVCAHQIKRCWLCDFFFAVPNFFRFFLFFLPKMWGHLTYEAILSVFHRTNNNKPRQTQTNILVHRSIQQSADDVGFSIQSAMRPSVYYFTGRPAIFQRTLVQYRIIKISVNNAMRRESIKLLFFFLRLQFPLSTYYYFTALHFLQQQLRLLVVFILPHNARSTDISQYNRRL